MIRGLLSRHISPFVLHFRPLVCGHTHISSTSDGKQGATLVTPYEINLEHKGSQSCWYEMFIDGKQVWNKPFAAYARNLTINGFRSDGEVREFVFSFPAEETNKDNYYLSVEKETQLLKGIGSIVMRCSEATFVGSEKRYFKSKRIEHTPYMTDYEYRAKGFSKRDCNKATGGNYSLTTTYPGRSVCSFVDQRPVLRSFDKYKKGSVIEEVELLYRPRSTLIDLGVLSAPPTVRLTAVKQGSTPAPVVKRSGTPAVGNPSKKMCMFTPSERNAIPLKLRVHTPSEASTKLGVYTPSVAQSLKANTFTPSGPFQKTSVFTPSELLRRRIKMTGTPIPSTSGSTQKDQESGDHLPTITEDEAEEDQEVENILEHDESIIEISPEEYEDEGTESEDDDGIIIIEEDAFLFSPTKRDKRPESDAQTQSQEEEESVDNNKEEEGSVDNDEEENVDNNEEEERVDNEEEERVDNNEEEENVDNEEEERVDNNDDQDWQEEQDADDDVSVDCGSKPLDDDDELSATSADESCISYEPTPLEHSIISVEDM